MNPKYLAVCFVAAIGFAAPVARAAKPVTITLWSWSPVAPTMKKMVVAIEKRHPEIKIDTTVEPISAYLTATKAAAPAGTLPDIMGLPAPAYAQQYRSHLQDLTPTATALWGKDWKKNFAPALLSEARLGNPNGDHAFYMLPEEAEVLDIWYNKHIFAKVGISHPPRTFKDLVADAQAIRRKGFIPFYQGGATGLFDAWLYMEIAAQTSQADLRAAEEGKPVWMQPPMLKAAEVWKKLFTEKVVQAGALAGQQYPTGANLFAAGRVGMIAMGSWWLQETHLSQSPDLTTMSGYGNFFFPAVGSSNHPSPPLGGIDIGWGITKKASRNPAIEDAAQTVLKELISGAGEQVALNQLNDLPAFNGMNPTTRLPPQVASLYHNYIKELQLSVPHSIGNPVIYQALISNLQAIAAGSKSPTNAMSAVQRVAQRVATSQK